MCNKNVILHRPAKAQSIEGIISAILQILAVFDALYNVFTSLFGNSR